jgi:nicotinamidase/pyrazinamidase
MPGFRSHLLIIDPQNDFCDLPESYCPCDPHTGELIRPALPVPGAHADLQRLAELIDRVGDKLTDITITLDSHHRLDIGHPDFWRDAEGRPITPFTRITAADVRSGRYRPRPAGAVMRMLSYLNTLEAAGRYTHTMWPVHCEIGTFGHNVHHDLRLAYNRWEERRPAIVDKVFKGSHPWTEHYSAIQAEVPDPAAPSTETNARLVARLREADRVYIAGEAGSHCVKATTEHLAEQFGPADAGKLALIQDCMSPVAGFEAEFTAFLDEMRGRGVRIATASEILAELSV